MRRVITLLLTVAMALSLGVVANATSTEKQSVYLKTKKVESGDTVTYTFTLDASKCKGVGALEFYVVPTNLTFQSKSYPEATKLQNVFEVSDFSGGSGHVEFHENENYFIAYGGNTQSSPARVLTGSVILVSVTYKINASNYDLKVTGFKACYDGEQAKLTTTRYNCVVGNGVLKGDINGDGYVDAGDRIILVRYLAKWSAYKNQIVEGENSFLAADINDDGYVDAGDRIILIRYLAKWHQYDHYFQ